MVRRILLSFALLSVCACSKEASDYPDLIVDDIRVGKHRAVGAWDTITVHYTGRLKGGKVFDTSRNNAEPSKYSMRGKTLIEGWRLGLIGMKVGGKRRLTIPPELAYGQQGKLGRFPPNSTVVFDIELFAVE